MSYLNTGFGGCQLLSFSISTRRPTETGRSTSGRFGCSGPAAQVLERYDLTVRNIAKAVKDLRWTAAKERREKRPPSGCSGRRSLVLRRSALHEPVEKDGSLGMGSGALPGVGALHQAQALGQGGVAQFAFRDGLLIGESTGENAL